VSTRRAPAAALGLALALVILVGFALRVAALGAVPFGFHPDEGHNALDAWAIANGWRPAFLPGNNGREPLFMYLAAALQAAGGASIWSTRLAAAVAGTLYLPAQYVFTRALPLPRPRLTALAATAIAATAFWPVAQSRYALRASLLPLWVALCLWAWWRAVEPERRVGAWPRWSALAGAFLAAAAHTHLTGRALPLLLAASAAWAARGQRSRRPLAALAVACAVALVLAAPQLRYFTRHPEMLSYRAEQVSLLQAQADGAETVAALRRNALALARAPLLRGDRSWYHNLSGRPVFDPLVGAAFLLGLALLARDLAGRHGPRRRHAAALLALSLALAALPSLFSRGAPNYVRLTATWPALFALAGWGLAAAAAWVARAARAGGLRAGPLSAAVAPAVVGTVIAVGGALAARDYFLRYAPRQETYDAFNAAAVERGLALADLSRRETTYASEALWRQAVIRFLCLDAPPRSYDAAAGLVLPAAGALTYVLEGSEEERARAVSDRHPWLSHTLLPDSRGAPSLRLLGAPEPVWRAGVLAGLHRPGPADEVRFGDAIALAGWRVEPAAAAPGVTVTVLAVWRALSATAVDHNRFVHVVGPDGRTIGQHDGPPLAGTYPTDRWRAGETVWEPIAVRLADDAPSGVEATVLAGWYDWRDGARLGVPGRDEAAVALGRLRVGAP